MGELGRREGVHGHDLGFSQRVCAPPLATTTRSPSLAGCRGWDEAATAAARRTAAQSNADMRPRWHEQSEKTALPGSSRAPQPHASYYPRTPSILLPWAYRVAQHRMLRREAMAARARHDKSRCHAVGQRGASGGRHNLPSVAVVRRDDSSSNEHIKWSILPRADLTRRLHLRMLGLRPLSLH